MTRTLVWLTTVLVCGAGPAAAHPAPFSYLDLRPATSGVEATLVVHVLDVAHELGVPQEALLDPARLRAEGERIAGLLAARLRLSTGGDLLPAEWGAPEPAPERDGIRLQGVWRLARPAGRFVLAAHLFPYDPVHQTFVNVYDGEEVVRQAILGRDRTELAWFAGTRQGTLAVIRAFAASGVHHILIGPDHLLFLVGLLLLGGTLRRLLLVVTAFTVAHSLTLSLAALDLFSPPAAIVEPAIALSVVYVGADNLTVRGGRDMRVWIAFAFGLIHGFGFAGVLREMELPARALGWSLFSFNLGVEIGQVAVVILVASIVRAIRARSEAAGRRLAVGGSIVVIAAGTFWFVQRVFFSGGAA